MTAGALTERPDLDETGILSGTPTATGTSTFTVTATDANGFAGTQQYTIGVTAAPLVSIAVAPNPATIKVGQVQQLTATGTYADSSTADLTSQVTWTSDAPNAVTVDTSGKVTGKAAGSSAHHGDAGGGERAGDGDGVAAGADGSAAAHRHRRAGRAGRACRCARHARTAASPRYSTGKWREHTCGSTDGTVGQRYMAGDLGDHFRCDLLWPCCEKCTLIGSYNATFATFLVSRYPGST